APSRLRTPACQTQQTRGLIMRDTRRTDLPPPRPRRAFLRGAAIAAAGMTIVPRHVLGGQGFTAPSDLVNVAGVGIGGMGRSNMTALSSQNIVALCDVDWGFVERGYDRIPEQIEGINTRLKGAASATAEQREGAQRQIAGLQQLHTK